MSHTPPPVPQAPGPLSACAPRWPLLFCLLAVAAAVLAYRDVGFFGFCNLDDSVYVTENRLVLSGLSWDTVRRAFVPDNTGYLSPLVTLSFVLDAQAFGFWAGGFHLVNLSWHVANVVLFFWLVLRLSDSRIAALLAAALLAVHPAHVEAVAWISARKDMLSTFFGLAAIHIYIGWARRPRASLNAGLHAAHVLSLMAKPMLVTLPGLLVLLDFWPLRRLGAAEGGVLPDWRELAARVREKSLLLALGVLAAFVALSTHMQTFDRLDPGLGLKVANALASCAGYLKLLVWPSNQALVYPFPESVPLAHSLGGAGLVLGLTALCVWQVRRRPYLLVGWLWFLCALIPVIMPPRVGMHVAMADRWAYVPFLGLYLALGCLVAEAFSALRRPWARVALCLALLAPLAALTLVQQRQLATWATPSTIYEQALRVTRKSHVVLNNYGGIKVAEGDDAAAEELYREALRLHPTYDACLYNLGLLCMRGERFDEALDFLTRARPEMKRVGKEYEAMRAMAHCLARLGRPGEAQVLYLGCLELEPGKLDAWLDWAKLAEVLGQRDRALGLYRMSLTVVPGNPNGLDGVRRLEAPAPSLP